MNKKLTLLIFVGICAIILFGGIYSTVDKTVTVTDELKSSLKSEGVSLSVEKDGASSSFLSSSSCDMLWLDDEKTNGVMVAFYSDYDTAYYVADQLDFSLIDFSTIPHFYLYQNSIVTYFGVDEDVITALENVMGTAFCEGTDDGSFY